MLLLAGINKFMDPSGITGMLGGLSLFAYAPAFWAWILLLSEIIFGAAVLLGWKVKYTAWPLIVALAIATVFFGIPGAIESENWTNVLFHLISISALWYISVNGPGIMAVSKKA